MCKLAEMFYSRCIVGVCGLNIRVKRPEMNVLTMHANDRRPGLARFALANASAHKRFDPSNAFELAVGNFPFIHQILAMITQPQIRSTII